MLKYTEIFARAGANALNGTRKNAIRLILRGSICIVGTI